MNRDERMLYVKNTISYNLVVLFVLLNTIHAIYELNAVEVDQTIGFIVMITIFQAMVGFLTAVKLQTYSLTWSYVAIGLGIYQFSRLFMVPSEIAGKLSFNLGILLILSVIAVIAGGVISIIKSNKRINYLKEHYTKKELIS